MSFYTGNIANLAGYPSLTKNIFLWNTSLTTTYILSMSISMAKQWNQEQNSVKHKLGKHQRVRRRKIRRSAGLPLFLLCWLQSFTRRCSLEFQSWVQRIDKGFVHSLHQVIITSLLEDKQTFKHGGRWSKCIVLPMVLRSKKKERKKEEERKEKKMNDDEKLLGSFSFIKLQVLWRLFYTQLFQPCAIR